MDESIWVHGIPETFRLKGRQAAVALDHKGLNHPRSPNGDAFVVTPYEDVTHVAVAPRGLWVGARKSVYVLPRRSFEDESAPDRIAESLLRRIGERPGGEAQLERMAAVERRAVTTGGAPATIGLAVLCVVVSALQLLVGDDLERAGHFSAAFVAIGDWWRLFTWNFLHAFPGFPLHLVMNVLGLAALGMITERSLGTGPTVVVLGASAVGALVANYLAGYSQVVGVSGVVFGLLGAVFWLEHARTEVLPAWWRVPRRALYIMAILSTVLAVLPIIAGLSHLGGFLFGGAAAALVSRGAALPRPNRLWIRGAAAGVVAVSAISLFAVGAHLLTIPDYRAFHLARMAEMPDVDPLQLNNTAWFIAIDPEASDALRETALMMAERAVAETDHREPAHLDTLAELQFQLGFDLSAISTIEEALALTPDDPYLIEQRRRFIGERERDDPIWNPKKGRGDPTEEAGRSA